MYKRVFHLNTNLLKYFQEKECEREREDEEEDKKLGEATNALKTEQAVLEAQAQQRQDEGTTGIPLLQLIQQLLK